MSKIFKKLTGILSAVLLVASMSITSFAYDSETQEKEYVVNVAGKEIKLKEGEEIVIPLVDPNIDPNKISTREIFEGNTGKLSLTAGSKTVNYKITMFIPAARFSGAVNVTNVSHGGSSSSNRVTGFSGSVPYRALSGCRYSAIVTGAAYDLGGKVVARVVPNLITWVR
ncbi:hypothetical protein ACHDL8_001041 [Clostridioides difficile]|uniref:hypothetical protein n=1 Tax=Clostridioides TaxID=1870884 RepID=UPI000BB1717E|nr:hypothetical protein [Clostridioides difficile]MCC0658301.1 hypothetical protein [Clostridioides sp. ES-S-0123-01]MCV2286011.1 hypothetical protein [Clostridioides difficile]MDK3275631.1 hypothetical protein [Clostridioides difficile]PBF98051.1 hypothetical protein BGV00_09860 [Clostridioides difficile]HBG2115622.1 hypothetical protein [Clostridioides difficile]